MENTRTVEIVVKLVLREDMEVSEIVSEMDYTFTHPGIVSTEIVDILTEI